MPEQEKRDKRAAGTAEVAELAVLAAGASLREQPESIPPPPKKKTGIKQTFRIRPPAVAFGASPFTARMAHAMHVTQSTIR